MVDNPDDNIVEVADPNQFQYNSKEGFSHQALVDKAYRRVIECLGREMIECGKVIEGYTDRQVEYMMEQHKLKHRFDKIKDG